MIPSPSCFEERLLLASAPPTVREWFLMQSEDHGPNGSVRNPRPRSRTKPLPGPIQELWEAHRRRCEPATILQRCADEGIGLLFPDDPGWPRRLNQLGKQAPGLLFLRGTLPTVPLIAMIGSRQPTPYGDRATDRLVAGCGGVPVGILSGLALGIDARAHAQALTHGLPTLAVLGSGVSETDIYPRKNAGLARDILAQCGGLLSETLPGAPLHHGSFPARNRLIAALSHAVIVIEAREKSGTLITARIALELGREVLAVPGSIFSEASDGTNALIAAGAHVCRETADLWHALAVDPPAKTAQARLGLPLSAENQALVETLRRHGDGATLDQLATALNSDPPALAARLGLLELQGLAEQGAAGRWSAAGLA